LFGLARTEPDRAGPGRPWAREEVMGPMAPRCTALALLLRSDANSGQCTPRRCCR
jgi:hypothetical protein